MYEQYATLVEAYKAAGLHEILYLITLLQMSMSEDMNTTSVVIHANGARTRNK